MEINNLIRRSLRIVSKGLIVALIGTSASLYKPVLAEAPSEYEGWNPQNIQTLLSHPLANENFELSEQTYNTYLLYTESISAGLSYKDFKKLKRVAFCESSLLHNDIIGDAGLAYGFFQFHFPTFELFAKKAKASGLEYKDIRSQIKLSIWAYQNKQMHHWTCWR